MTTTRQKGRAAPELVPAENAAPATAADFRRRSQDGEVYRLPGSGLPVRLRRPGLIGLIGAGVTDNPLITNELLEQLSGALKDQSAEEQIEAFRKRTRTYRELAARCLVEPRLVLDREPNYDANEIGPEDLPDFDYVWIYRFTQQQDDFSAAFRLPG